MELNKKIKISVFLLFFTLQSYPSLTQAQSSGIITLDSSIKITDSATVKNKNLIPLTILFNNGDKINGLLEKINEDSLFVLIGKIPRVFDLITINKLSFVKRHSYKSDAGYGIMIFTFAGMLFLGSAPETVNSWYLCRDFFKSMTPALLFSLWAVVSSNLSFKNSNPALKDVYDFEIDGKNDNWEILRLNSYLAEKPIPKIFNINLQSGFIFNEASGNIFKILPNFYKKEEISFEHDPWLNRHMGGPMFIHHSTSYNMLRNFQLGYSISPELETGFAYFNLNEPYMNLRKDENIQNSPTTTLISLNHKGSGYYIFGRYKKGLDGLFRKFNYTLGVGLGISNIYNELTAYYYFNPDQYEHYDYSRYFQKFENTYFSFFINPELNYFIYNGLSIGLTADYTFLPKADLTDIPQINVFLKSIGLSNCNIGFKIGLGF